MCLTVMMRGRGNTHTIRHTPAHTHTGKQSSKASIQVQETVALAGKSQS